MSETRIKSKENNSINRKKEIEFRALESDGKALLDREVIETFLSAVHDREEAQIIAKKLMDEFKGMGRVLGQETDDLKVIEGVTNSTVSVILCVRETLKRILKERLEKVRIIDNWKKLEEYLMVSMGHLDKEIFRIIYLDQGCHLIGEEDYAGTVDQVSICVKEVVRKGILKKATSIIVAHNHPGGSLEASEGDEALTNKLEQACDTVEINLIDHVIVTREGCFSFRERGL